MGQIGLGRIAQSHDMPGVIKSELADYVAVCDLDSKRVADGVKIVEKSYTERGMTAPKIRTFDNYRELLARKDIDAVVISTPDHWHAEVALAAVNAGKDVYLQKPFTMTHAEGVHPARCGEAQRPHPAGGQPAAFLGAVPPRRRADPLGPHRQCAARGNRPAHRSHRARHARREAVPANLDFSQWLGPTPFAYYTEMRVHPQKDYSRPGWLRHEAHCLGMITGWGSHHYDTMHWALEFENTGPSRVEGKGEFPPEDRIWNVHGAYDVTLQYPKNVVVNVSDKHNTGLKFFGDEGWIWVTREGTGATSSDPQAKGANLPPLDASDPKILDPNGVTRPLPVSKSHHKNWLECVQSRKRPLAPADVAHRSNSACIVSWIAMKLGRPLEWDPKAEKFKNDAEANAMLTRSERAPYGAMHLAKA